MKIKVKHLLYVGAFIICSICGFLMFPKGEETIVISGSSTISGDFAEYVFVHITGEVNEPGIKKVKKQTRIFELIEIAGGETSDADLSKINLASIVKDEQKVIIPSFPKEIEDNGAIIYNGGSKSVDGLVSINYGTKEQLETLTGIGPQMAQKIISYREENGGFGSLEDIKNVSGIGEAKYEKIKNDITI